MEVKQIELKIHLKCQKKPIVAILSNEKYVDEFYDALANNEIVKFGQIIFNRNEFQFAEIGE